MRQDLKDSVTEIACCEFHRTSLETLLFPPCANYRLTIIAGVWLV